MELKTMQQRIRAECLCLCLCFFLLMLGAATGDHLADTCGQAVQKVIPCLNFATGKAAAPTKECCDATTKIKDSNPECLCYIIQQTHKGSPESKQFGIQEAKLLQLPSACNLKNASVANCPKLLGLSPSSPDAAIFTNASASSATPGAPAKTGTSTSQNENYSRGVTLKPIFITDLIPVVSAILIAAIPTGFVSIFA